MIENIYSCDARTVSSMFSIFQKTTQEVHLSTLPKDTSVHSYDYLQKNDIEVDNLNTWIPKIVSKANVDGCKIEVTVHHPLNCHTSRVCYLQSRVSPNDKDSLKPTDFGIDDIPFIDDDQTFI